MQVHFDRRRKRSQVLQEALHMQLEAAAARLHAESLVLADEVGLVVARAGPLEKAEEVAALSPNLANARHLWSGRIRWKSGLRQLIIAPFRLLGEVLYLAALGPDTARLQPVMAHTQAGIRRILSSR